MVAYGVLELKANEYSINKLFLNGPDTEAERAAVFERDQLRKLVNDELRRYGLLLAREVVPKNTGWRTKNNSHILYGQLQGNVGFGVRPILHIGDFKKCCEFAAKVLDDLDRSQVPE